MSLTQKMTTDSRGSGDSPTPRQTEVDSQVAELCQKMRANIQDALALSRKLERVLESLHQKMLERNITAVERALDNQMQLLNMLQMNGALREHYLQPFGFSPDQRGIRQFLQLIERQPFSSTASEQSLDKYWAQLEGSANRCQQINNANGRLLARLSASTRKIIELTLSEQAAATYDQNGLTVNSMAE